MNISTNIESIYLYINVITLNLNYIINNHNIHVNKHIYLKYRKSPFQIEIPYMKNTYRILSNVDDPHIVGWLHNDMHASHSIHTHIKLINRINISFCPYITRKVYTLTPIPLPNPPYGMSSLYIPLNTPIYYKILSTLWRTNKSLSHATRDSLNAITMSSSLRSPPLFPHIGQSSQTYFVHRVWNI